jgi:hypothetical protein
MDAELAAGGSRHEAMHRAVQTFAGLHAGAGQGYPSMADICTTAVETLVRAGRERRTAEDEVERSWKAGLERPFWPEERGGPAPSAEPVERPEPPHSADGAGAAAGDVDVDGYPDPVSALDFMRATFPAPKWMVPGLLVEKLMHGYAGTSQSGKTALAIFAAIEAARAGYRVLFVEEECTERDFQDRLRAAGLAPETEPEALGRIALYSQKGVNLRDVGWQAKLEDVVVGCDVVFFDTFADVTPGMDQKEQAEVAEVLDWMRTLRNRFRCAVVALFHSPKAVFEKTAAPTLADVFGSVTIVNKLDQVFIVKPSSARNNRKPRSSGRSEAVREGYGPDPADEPEPEARALKPGDEARVTVFHRKTRGGGRGFAPPRHAVIRVVEVDKDAETGLPITAGVFAWKGLSAEEDARQRKRAQLRETILDHCAKNVCTSRNDVFEGVGGNRSAVLAAVGELVSSGLLREGPEHRLVSTVEPRVGLVVPTGTKLVPTPSGTTEHRAQTGILGPPDVVPGPPPVVGSGTRYQSAGCEPGTGENDPHPRMGGTEPVPPTTDCQAPGCKRSNTPPEWWRADVPWVRFGYCWNHRSARPGRGAS